MLTSPRQELSEKLLHFANARIVSGVKSEFDVRSTSPSQSDGQDSPDWLYQNPFGASKLNR